jgi:hypothetical protein
MRRLGLVLGLLALPAMWGADVNGKWSAKFETPRGPSEMEFNFKVDGDKVTGTVANPRGESEIQDGKIEGETLSFKQVMNFGREITILYSGKINGDEIEFTRKFEGGGPGGGRGGPGGGPGGGPRAGGGGGREGGPPAGGGRGGGMGREASFTAKRAK